MLEIGTQLEEALAYQVAIGAEGTVRHFDSDSNSIAGPISRPGECFRSSLEQNLRADGVGAMRVRIDSETDEYIGYFAIKA